MLQAFRFSDNSKKHDENEIISNIRRKHYWDSFWNPTSLNEQKSLQRFLSQSTARHELNPTISIENKRDGREIDRKSLQKEILNDNSTARNEEKVLSSLQEKREIYWDKLWNPHALKTQNTVIADEKKYYQRELNRKSRHKEERKKPSNTRNEKKAQSPFREKKVRRRKDRLRRSEYDHRKKSLTKDGMNMLNDGSIDVTGWGKHDDAASISDLISLRLKPMNWGRLLSKNRRKPSHSICPTCDTIDARYKDMVEAFNLKLHSRDTVIRTFEQASSIQNEALNQLREELEKKNSAIAKLKHEQMQQREKEVTLIIDLEIEKRTTHKLYKQMELLRSDFSRVEDASNEMQRKNDKDVRKLNDLVHLLKAQIKTKDEALDQILNSYNQRRKNIASLVKNVQAVETDHVSLGTSDNFTLSSPAQESEQNQITLNDNS